MEHIGFCMEVEGVPFFLLRLVSLQADVGRLGCWMDFPVHISSQRLSTRKVGLNLFNILVFLLKAGSLLDLLSELGGSLTQLL
jgi:hypothetical protein